MREYQRGYATARNVFALLELAGWALVVSGIIVALVGFSTGGIFSFGRYASFGIRLISALPGLFTSIIGLFAIAMVQSYRAHVDTAEMTRELLEIAKNSSKQAVNSGPAPSRKPKKWLTEDVVAKDDFPNPAKPPAKLKEGEEWKVEHYRGVEIYQRYNGYYANEKWFANLQSAREYVDAEKTKF